MVKFSLFIPDHKVFHLNKGSIFMIIFIFLGILFEHYPEAPVIKYSFLTALMIFFIGMFANMFRTRAIKGKFDGDVLFSPHYIQIKNDRYPIANISKIYIRITDYEGLYKIGAKPSLFRRLSNGTNNIVRLTLKDKTEITAYFKVNFIDDYQKMHPTVMALLLQNALSIEEAVKILRINSDLERKKIEDFVKKK